MIFTGHLRGRATRALFAGLLAMLLVCLLPARAQAAFSGRASVATTVSTATLSAPGGIVVTLGKSVCKKGTGPENSSVSWAAVAGATTYAVSVQDSHSTVYALGSTTSTSMVVQSGGVQLKNNEVWSVHVTASVHQWTSPDGSTTFECP